MSLINVLILEGYAEYPHFWVGDCCCFYLQHNETQFEIECHGAYKDIALEFRAKPEKKEIHAKVQKNENGKIIFLCNGIFDEEINE